MGRVGDGDEAKIRAMRVSLHRMKLKVLPASVAITLLSFYCKSLRVGESK